jgi:hypothetical protein
MIAPIGISRSCLLTALQALLFGADSASWTFWTYNLDGDTVILIVQGL